MNSSLKSDTRRISLLILFLHVGLDFRLVDSDSSSFMEWSQILFPTISGWSTMQCGAEPNFAWERGKDRRLFKEEVDKNL